MEPSELVVLPGVMSTGCAPPHSTNNLDGLGERLEVFSGTSVSAAHRGNRLPERAGAQAKLKAAPGSPPSERREAARSVPG